MDDQFVPALVGQRLNLDRMGTHRRKAVLVRFARGFSVFERRHVTYQYRRPPVPVPREVAVDGSPPDAAGGV